MYSCESWTIKKAERWRIDAFELWCWRSLLRVPWLAKRSIQSILKEINPENLLEVLMLKLQYFGHLIWTADSLEKTLMLGRTEGRGRRWWQRMRWLNGINGHELGQTPGDGRGQGGLECCSPCGHISAPAQSSTTSEELLNLSLPQCLHLLNGTGSINYYS